MTITGYKLREKLKMLELKRDSLDNQFFSSLHAFPEEVSKKRKPIVIADDLTQIEGQIALFQAAQAEYNQKVTVTVEKDTMTLGQAVKLVGGVARIIERWKRASNEVSSDRDRVRVKRKDDEVTHAAAQISPDEVLFALESAEKRAAALRGAIAHGNSLPADITLDLSLA
jgi:hypothetical protein